MFRKLIRRLITSKGLEALDKLYNIPIYEENDNQCSDLGCCCDYKGDLCEVYYNEIDDIEKELRALEIIKRKKVDVKLLLDNDDDRIRPEYRFFDYNCTRKWEEKIDQEEFDLLIEILKN